jgi:periplasmic protein TonB
MRLDVGTHGPNLQGQLGGSMFDLITESIDRPLRERSLGSRIISIVGHVVVLLMVVVLPVLFAADALPPVPPVMMAFVAAASAPPPPPPPPPPPAPRAATPAAARPVHSTNQFAAPIEAPTEVRPEPAVPSARALDGVEGGVEGGVPGGIVGGIVGDIVSLPPPPPPPPPPPLQPREPVRIGGNISAPELLRRVEPEYPELAVSAHVNGRVILEAVFNAQGCLESVKVLRSPHRLLERAAMDALRQWQYSPLMLNGSPSPFVLTVTFNFSIGASGA